MLSSLCRMVKKPAPTPISWWLLHTFKGIGLDQWPTLDHLDGIRWVPAIEIELAVHVRQRQRYPHHLLVVYHLVELGDFDDFGLVLSNESKSNLIAAIFLRQTVAIHVGHSNGQSCQILYTALGTIDVQSVRRYHENAIVNVQSSSFNRSVMFARAKDQPIDQLLHFRIKATIHTYLSDPPHTHYKQDGVKALSLAEEL
jgi:hypothetical protein